MKKLLNLFTVVFFVLQLHAQDFYDINTIQSIKITFAQTNWDQLLDAAYAGTGDYIMAESIEINGQTFDSVGVKYKGNSTYQANQAKNPFHIELDTYKDQDYDGYTDIKLSNGAKDPSFLREVLSYKILRQYMDAPLSNYAVVYVNGNLIGLYSNSEAISKKFVNSRFGSKNNTFVKCNPPDGAGPGTNDLPNLSYNGQDSSNYYSAYEMKSDDGWQELINLCDTLTNNVGEIEKILDVDRALWMLAFDNVLVNLDSYIGGFAQNYYLYRDDNHRFIPIIWDLNESFGQFSMTGTGPLNNTNQKIQMDHLLNINDSDFPLVQKLLSIPQYKRMYLAHYKTILLENFENDSYYTTALQLRSLIDTSVQADPNKLYTYNNFITNLTSDVSSGGGPGGSTSPGITNLMDNRTSYLLSLNDFSQTEPEITSHSLSDPTPLLNQTITLTAEVNNATTVYLGYRGSIDKPFNRIEMFDDGAHNDGNANDGIYGTELNISNTFMQYYIYAENNGIGKFSPQRAEYEFYLINATINGTAEVVINEFMASNNTTAADQDGEYDDWIELFNNSSSNLNISGYYLSDDEDNTLKWAFPAGTEIAANSFLIVWADKDENQAGLHSNFKLSAAGETIFLSDDSGEILDQVSYTSQNPDEAFARIPNGTGSFQSTSPTFNAFNTEPNEIDHISVESIDFIVAPNPANTSFTIRLNSFNPQIQKVSIYNSLGTMQFSADISESLTINCSNWAKGMYFIRIGNTSRKIIKY